MKVAVVGGTAGLGFGLSLRLGSRGHDVWIGSRQEEKANAAAAEAKRRGVEVLAGANPDVVQAAETVVVAVPFPGQAATYKAIKDSINPGAAVIDCTVPLASEVGGRATRMLGVWEGSAAQQAKGLLGKDVKMASGFHTVMAARLERLDDPLDADVLVCGDSEAKEAAKALVDSLGGARFVDCGPLETARILESLTALLIGINHRYKLDLGAGISITGLST